MLYRDEVDAPPAPDPLSWGGRVTTAAQERIRPNAFLQHMHGEVVAGWEEGEEGWGGEEGEEGEEAASMIKKLRIAPPRIEPHSAGEDARVRPSEGGRQSEGKAAAGAGQAARGGEGAAGEGEVQAGEVQAAAFHFEASVRVWSDYLQVLG